MSKPLSAPDWSEMHGGAALAITGAPLTQLFWPQGIRLECNRDGSARWRTSAARMAEADAPAGRPVVAGPAPSVHSFTYGRKVRLTSNTAMRLMAVS